MSKYPLCRYCGEEMYILSRDYTDVEYSCNCEGYKTQKNLELEIEKIKNSLFEAEKRLANHKYDCFYETKKRGIKKQLEDLESNYYYKW